MFINFNSTFLVIRAHYNIYKTVIPSCIPFLLLHVEGEILQNDMFVKSGI